MSTRALAVAVISTAAPYGRSTVSPLIVCQTRRERTRRALMNLTMAGLLSKCNNNGRLTPARVSFVVKTSPRSKWAPVSKLISIEIRRELCRFLHFLFRHLAPRTLPRETDRKWEFYDVCSASEASLTAASRKR